jgi:hypothetical protein
LPTNHRWRENEKDHNSVNRSDPFNLIITPNLETGTGGLRGDQIHQFGDPKLDQLACIYSLSGSGFKGLSTSSG